VLAETKQSNGVKGRVFSLSIGYSRTTLRFAARQIERITKVESTQERSEIKDNLLMSGTGSSGLRRKRGDGNTILSRSVEQD